MKTIVCPFCASPSAQEETYEHVQKRGDQTISVNGLKHFVCPECQSVFSNDEQSRYNLRAIQVAMGEEPKFLSSDDIRGWREEIGITQREAARVLGGGLNAFSKYENGEVVQSEAMDNLLWLVKLYPGLLADLAQRRGISLSDVVSAKCGRVFQGSYVISSMTTLSYPIAAETLGHSISWWKGLDAALFLEGSWSQKGFTYSPDDASYAANDEAFVYQQQA